MAAAPDEASISVKTEPELPDDVKNESLSVPVAEEPVLGNGHDVSPKASSPPPAPLAPQEPPDRQTLLAVLQFLKKSNLKDSVDILRRECGLLEPDGSSELSPSAQPQSGDNESAEQSLLSRVTAGGSAAGSSAAAAGGTSASGHGAAKGDSSPVCVTCVYNVCVPERVLRTWCCQPCPLRPAHIQLFYLHQVPAGSSLIPPLYT